MNLLHSRRNAISVLAIVLFAWLSSSAQNITNYSFSTQSGSFVPLTEATIRNIFDTDQGFYTLIPIGFDFVYMGAVKTVFVASTDGWATFSQQSYSFGSVNNLTSHSTRPILAPLWDNLDMASGTFSYKTEGTAPSRVFTAEWLNAEWYAFANTPVISFQVKLYESTGVVEYVYRQEAAAVNSGSASVGLSAVATGSGNFLSLNGTGSSPSVSSTVETTDLSTKPATGQIYAFTPPVPTAPTNLTFSSVNATGMTLNWNDNSSNEMGFFVYRSDDGGTTYNLISATAANATSSIQSGLSLSTSYSWRVVAVSEGAVSAAIAGTQATSAPTLSGTRTVGPAGGNYATITAALADVHTQGLNGPLILELQTAYASGSETYPITFTNLTTTATNTLTIRPASGATGRSITTSNFNGTIDLNGAAHVTIDGRPGGIGTSKELTIGNTYAVSTGPAVRFINDASNNIIKYTVLTATTPYSGVVNFFGTTGVSGNDNNFIDNCNIGGGAKGIYSLGAAEGKENSGNIVSNCRIYNFYSNSDGFGAGISLGFYNTSWTITGNSFYQTSGTAGTTIYGVRISTLTTGDNFTVSDNFIGGSAANAAGSWAVGYSNIIGLYFDVGSKTPSSVQNNTIAGFSNAPGSGTTLPGGWCGIYVKEGSVSIGGVAGNTIGSSSATGSISFDTQTTGLFYGIASESSGEVVISNNTVGGFTFVNSNTSFHSSSFRGIEVTAGDVTITSNVIGSTSTARSILAGPSTTSVSGGQYMIAIQSAATTALIADNTIANITNEYSGSSNGQTVGIQVYDGVNTITGNTIRNIVTKSPGGGSGVSSPLVGINLYQFSYGGQTISNNTIHSLIDSAASGNVAIAGIEYNAASTGTNTISRNFVHSLSTTTSSQNAFIVGIDIRSDANCINNMVRLGIHPNGNAISTPFYIGGISCKADVNAYFNSVFIGGNNVGNASTFSYAFEHDYPGTVDARNNIFVNNRSNDSVGGKHYAVRSSDLTPLASNHNLFHLTGNGAVFGAVGSSDYSTFCSWRSATGGDSNSRFVDPQFVNPLGSNADIDLHIYSDSPTPVEGAGVVIPSVTDDFDGGTRSGLTPVDIGADAGSFTFFPDANFGGGGSANGGYYFANSTCEASSAPAQPYYAWFDPVSLGHTEVSSWTEGNGDNGYFGPVALRFTFDFFGTRYSSFYINSNGMVTFGAGSLSDSPISIPTEVAPNNFIAAAWTNLDLTKGLYSDAHVYYGGDVNQHVITFFHAHAFGSSTDYITFQIILNANGNVKIQYNDAETTKLVPTSITDVCAVGIENDLGSAGIQYRLASGGPMFGSPLALEFGMNSAALPVELTTFKLSTNRLAVSLSWATATETNNLGFEIERRPVGARLAVDAWQSAGFVHSSGSSSSPREYSFVDHGVPPGRYAYRIKQIDGGGGFTYSTAMEVEVGLAPKELTLSENYPNPFNPATTIEFTVPEDGEALLRIYNSLGQVVTTLFDGEATAGRIVLAHWNPSGLASGIYFSRLEFRGRQLMKKITFVK